MADDASRLWHLSDSAFLSHFNTTYPQQQSWVLCPLRLNMSSAVISALQKKRPSPESFLAEMLPPARTGQSGPVSVSPSTRSGGVPPLRRSGLHQRGGPGPTPPGRHPPP
jgi:hypothetical protein